jgi:Uma2 family endonuclease
MQEKGHQMTATELLERQPLHVRSELVRGTLRVREPAGYAHGKFAIAIGAALHAWVAPRQLGDVVGAETGFTLRRNPDTVRAADAAFISAARVPAKGCAGFAELAPDLVVEVLSPSDREGDVQAKVADWLDAGVRLVWLIDGQRRRATVHRADGTSDVRSSADDLDGETVLPGFALPLGELFRD